MEGWRPVAELTRWGFAHAQAVMANEAHDGLRDLLAALDPQLAAWGGTAGILRGQAPDPLCRRTGVDALVVSTDNTLT